MRFNPLSLAPAALGVPLLVGALLFTIAAPTHGHPAAQDQDPHGGHGGAVAPDAVPAVAGVAAEIRFFYFSPDPLVVAPGTTVTWTNADAIVHSVTAGAPGAIGAFDSGLFDEGETFSFTFAEPGEYAYFCLRHPAMRGLVTVTP